MQSHLIQSKLLICFISFILLFLVWSFEKGISIWINSTYGDISLHFDQSISREFNKYWPAVWKHCPGSKNNTILGSVWPNIMLFFNPGQTFHTAVLAFNSALVLYYYLLSALYADFWALPIFLKRLYAYKGMRLLLF